MADENQGQNRIGVVGQPSQTPQQGQPGQPQRGVPGAQQPPVPSPEQIAKVMAEQQRIQQQQVAEAQKRAQALAEKHQPGQAVASMHLDPPAQQPVSQAPQQAAPQQPQGHVVMTHGKPDAVPSPVPGMTAQQVLAGFPNPPTQVQPQMPQQPKFAPQPQAQPQPAQPQGNQFAQYSQPQPVDKILVPWYPMRSKGVDVELEDSIITKVPEKGIEGEGDAAAKVVIALFSEVLALRQRVAQLEEGGGGGLSQEAITFIQQLGQRVYNLEATLYEQRQSMQSRARGVKEQIQLLMAQGKSPEEVLAALQSQAEAATELASSGGPVAQPSHIDAENQGEAQSGMVEQAASVAQSATTKGDGG